MEKKWHFISGIDVSKKTFDAALSTKNSDLLLCKAKFSNTLKGFDKYLKWLSDQNVKRSDMLVCMENTGIYNRLLVEYLLSKNIFVWVETPLEIKWSSGIQRGKSDTIDSERIMAYAYRYQDKARNYEPKQDTIRQIADFLSLRSRLQQCIQVLKVPIKELRSIGLIEDSKRLEEASIKSISTLQEELGELDIKILALIENDTKVKEIYEIVTSVRCVGYVTAVYLLVYTNGFTKFKSAKQLACYSGIAPFENSSGTSIRGRTKVHHMGNKNLKTILHMCAVSSIRHNPEMKKYFSRKVAQGKNKMLVINSVRNKIVARVFSCVQNKRHYTDNYAA